MDRRDRIQEVLSAALERPTVEREAFVARACGGDERLIRAVHALLKAHAASGSPESSAGTGADTAGNARLLTLFEHSFRLAPDARAAYLDDACAGDPHLRREVEALLEAGAETGPLAPDVLQASLASWLGDAERVTGDTVAHYEIVEKLGGGGMGIVFKARDTRLDRTVALKFMPPHLSTDAGAKERFLVEARAAAQLEHTNLCTIFEIGETSDGRLFIAMAYCAGETLKAEIARGPLAIDRAVDLARQIALGLGRAHHRGVVHRDIKPANVIVTREGVVKIVDFGIAKVTDQDLTQTGATLGTVAYMSPEQARGEAVDHRTDIWSLGVVLYEMLAGRRPFEGAYEQAVLYQILNEAPAPLGSLRPEVPPGLVRLVEKALAKKPDARYASLDLLLADLERPDRTSASRSATAVPTRSSATVFQPEAPGAPLLPEGERRQATVAVSILNGYHTLVEQLSPEDVGQVMMRMCAHALETAQRHGGVVNRCSNDELVLLFGIPATHEDDPIRAVRAVHEIHAYTRALSDEIADRIAQPLRLATGLDTGLVAAQPLDAGDTAYRIAGRPAQDAGLLAVQAEADEILASPESRRLLAPFFETEARDPVRLKGRTGRVTPFRVGEESGRQSRLEAAERAGLTAYTGRDEELAILRRSLELALLGEGQFVTIAGEAGLGKSRLLYEFRRTIESGTDTASVRLLRGRCQSYGTQIPYLPFIDALRDTLGVSADDARDAGSAEIAERIRTAAPELENSIPLYLHLLSIDDAAYPLPKHLEGEHFRLALQEALAALFTLGTANAPTAMLLEDWHWADEASTEVLEQLVEMAAVYPLLIVVTYRPGYGTEWNAALHPTPVHLKPVGPDASAAILASVLGCPMFPREPGRLLHERTSGNPFFLEEIAKTLCEDGTLRVENARVVVTRPLERAHLPDTVQAVIRTRLHRMDREAQAVLRLASVVGREFSREVLRHVSPGETALLPALEKLRGAGLIRQTRVLPDATYRFKHALTLEVAYESLLAHQRKHLHGLVGAAIEVLYPDRLDEQADLLAQHFSRAEDWAKAVHYGLEAARKGHRLSRFPEALQMFERTQAWLLRQPETSERRDTLVEILLARERLYETMGQRERQQHLIDEMLTLIEPDGTPAQRAAVYQRQGDLYTLLRRFDEAEQALGEALRLHREIGDEPGVRHVIRSLGMLCWHAGRHPEAIEYIEAALAIDRRRENYEALIGDLSNLGHVLKSMDRLEEALVHMHEAVALAEQIGNPSKQVYGLHGVSRLYYMAGDMEKAKAYLERAIKLSSKYRLPIQNAYHLTSLANMLREEGNYEESLRLCRKSVEMSRRSRHAEGQAQSLATMCDLLLQLGRHAEALPYLEESTALYAQLKSLHAEAIAWSKVALCREALGADADAMAAWGKACTIHRQASDGPGELEALERLAHVTRRHVAEPSLALGYYSEALGLAQRLRDRSTEGRLHNTMGILEWNRSGYEAALGHYQQALSCFQELDDPVHQSLMLNSIGVTLRKLKRTDEAVVCLEEGAALSRRSGQDLLEGHALAALGEIAYERRSYDEALMLFERSLELRQIVSDRKGAAWMHYYLARAHAAQGELGRARTHTTRALHIAEELDDPDLAAACRRL